MDSFKFRYTLHTSSFEAATKGRNADIEVQCSHLGTINAWASSQFRKCVPRHHIRPKHFILPRRDSGDLRRNIHGARREKVIFLELEIREGTGESGGPRSPGCLLWPSGHRVRDP
ncbi:hypothetical protein CC2G_004608 [Coprinopsis cinerea AmutBmut pab1-1]|nr:hypothetical protein CC2G_004608 [Coprinopsis cinerea AmutBmut pab1-1]